MGMMISDIPSLQNRKYIAVRAGPIATATVDNVYRKFGEI